MKIWYFLRAWWCTRQGHPYPFIALGDDPAMSWCSNCATLGYAGVSDREEERR